MVNSASQHLLSGGLSGFCSAIALQPLDLIKTRIQQVDGATARQHASSLSITRQIVSQDGAFGLWRGTIPTLTRNVPGVALYFYSLQLVRQKLASFPTLAVPSPETNVSALPKLSTYGNLMAGAATRLGVGFVLNPFSVVKARFESNHYAYRSMGEAFRSIIQTSGPSGLLQGFKASALRDAPYAGVFVLFYELIKDQSSALLTPYLQVSPSVIHSWSGASAGVIATLATHPFDVMKTKMQVRSDDRRYRSLTSTTLTVLRERGLRGFFDGSTVRIGRKVLSSAISWTVYEALLLSMRSP